VPFVSGTKIFRGSCRCFNRGNKFATSHTIVDRHLGHKKNGCCFSMYVLFVIKSCQ
jgi:hypothetical protein